LVEDIKKDLAKIFGVPINVVTETTKVASEFLRFQIKLNSCFMDKRFEKLSAYTQENNLIRWFLTPLPDGIEISFPKK
jgi:hypothetical protein